ncbi:hypothetical protein [Rhizohabitans arisaemae]|uniref:hypothetical protein n=1 Tax=Rhizohabitans arisaemae TaxID=2720610 RepID=UPI0024B16316|nr:hypothetical protein [Rhizohabitans arisaemae]
MVDRVVRRAAVAVAAVAIGLSAFVFTAPTATASFWMLSGPYPTRTVCQAERVEMVANGGANVTRGCHYRDWSWGVEPGWYFEFITY